MPIALLEIEDLLADVVGGEGNFVVIDARPEPEYLRGHIPGAVRISWEDWCECAPSAAPPILHEPGYWGKLANSQEQLFEKKLSDAGIKQHLPIVVYADSANSKGREGRVAWMFLYFGASEVFMLNGGWNAWVNACGPVQLGNRAPCSAGDFRIALDEERRVTHDQVFRNQSGQTPLMIDTRTTAEFDGDCYDYQPVKGRLPNAILFPFTSLFSPDGSFITKELYLKIVPSDILTATDKISYCEVGVRASTFSLLHEIYTGEIIPVYDGSIMEWGWQLENKSQTNRTQIR